jgi:hypothetical protein
LRRVFALSTSKLFIIPLINHQIQPLDKNFASLNTLHNGFSCTSVRDKDLKEPFFHNLPKFESQTPHYLSAMLHILPLLHRKISTKSTSLGSSLASHLVSRRLVATYTYQIEENDTKISMLSNTIASPFSDLPCLHAIETKHSQPPTEKKNTSLKNPKTTSCSHSEP